jgi:hypothetical protein
MTHEIINAINAKLEVEPFNCSPLVADPGITNASEYEASRLSKLTDDCYLKYLQSIAADGDFDSDCDVDGNDLAVLIANISLIDLTTFAQNIGKSAACQ